MLFQECQQGVIGERSALPELSAAARQIVPNLARIAAAARGAGSRVCHCLFVRRPDGFGTNRNARLFKGVERSPVPLHPGTEAARVLPEIGVEEADLVVTRSQGLSPFQNSELDAVLRNEGIRTLVVTGVSVNVAIQNLVFDAVNASYQVVVPRDAVAGLPADYVEAVLTHTLALVATLTTTVELLEAWQT